MDLDWIAAQANRIGISKLSTSREGWGCVARMARISVRSGSLKRSVAEWIPLNHAV
jgi:hypothetical protein